MLSIGTVVGACVDNRTHTINGKLAYKIPLTLFFIAPTIQSIVMIFAPESPRWLMVQGKEEAAEKALRSLRNSQIDEHELQAELNEIRGSTREQVEMNKKWLFLEMWRGTNLRRTVLSICVVCFHCANGQCSLYITIFGWHWLSSYRLFLDQHLYDLLPNCRGNQERLRLFHFDHLHGTSRCHLQYLLCAFHQSTNSSLCRLSCVRDMSVGTCHHLECCTRFRGVRQSNRCIYRTIYILVYCLR
jgi:hypothetical protein